jgi:hypothetical protein
VPYYGSGGSYNDPAGDYGEGGRVGVLLNCNDDLLCFFKDGTKYGPGCLARSAKEPAAAMVDAMLANGGSASNLFFAQDTPQDLKFKRSLCSLFQLEPRYSDMADGRARSGSLWLGGWLSIRSTVLLGGGKVHQKRLFRYAS